MINYRADLYKVIDLTLPSAELGCAEGYFSADILSWGVPKHYMVDNWGNIPNQSGDGGNDDQWHNSNFIKSMDRVKDYGDKVVILRGMSVPMADKVENNSLGFVNVDCDHSYRGVMGDIKAWWPKLVTGGVMAFHDFEATQYGVKMAVHEFAAINKLTVNLLPENKIEDAGAYLIK
jgi:hypothetical protein